jgi:hypothetical protein
MRWHLSMTGTTVILAPFSNICRLLVYFLTKIRQIKKNGGSVIQSPRKLEYNMLPSPILHEKKLDTFFVHKYMTPLAFKKTLATRFLLKK